MFGVQANRDHPNADCYTLSRMSVVVAATRLVSIAIVATIAVGQHCSKFDNVDNCTGAFCGWCESTRSCVKADLGVMVCDAMLREIPKTNRFVSTMRLASAPSWVCQSWWNERDCLGATFMDGAGFGCGWCPSRAKTFPKDRADMTRQWEERQKELRPQDLVFPEWDKIWRYPCMSLQQGVAYCDDDRTELATTNRFNDMYRWLAASSPEWICETQMTMLGCLSTFHEGAGLGCAWNTVNQTCTTIASNDTRTWQRDSELLLPFPEAALWTVRIVWGFAFATMLTCVATCMDALEEKTRRARAAVKKGFEVVATATIAVALLFVAFRVLWFVVTTPFLLAMLFIVGIVAKGIADSIHA